MHPKELRQAAIADAKKIGTIKAAAKHRISPQSLVGWCNQIGVRIWKPAQKVVCERCSKEFSVRRGNPHNRKACSKKCRSIGERIDVSCRHCGKITNYAKSLQKKFCSHRCYAKSNINPNPAPKRRGANWKKVRAACLKKSGGRCRVCGIPGNDVHHVIPFKYFKGDYIAANDQTNLETTCVPCHQEAERRNRAIFKAITALEGESK